MSQYANKRLYAKGCENTVYRAHQTETKLLRAQNVEKQKLKATIRSWDTEARHRDDMIRHFDLHRQMITTTVDKYAQYNAMWNARDDLYRKRREEAYARRIARYIAENDAVEQQTDEFNARKHRILVELPEQQRELLERKISMTKHSRINEEDMYRYSAQNPTMTIAPTPLMRSAPELIRSGGATPGGERRVVYI
jgi:hypothetical protein